LEQSDLHQTQVAGITWKDGASSELDNTLGKVDIWYLSTGGDIAPVGMQEVWSRECATTGSE